MNVISPDLKVFLKPPLPPRDPPLPPKDISYKQYWSNIMCIRLQQLHTNNFRLRFTKFKSVVLCGLRNPLKRPFKKYVVPNQGCCTVNGSHSLIIG